MIGDDLMELIIKAIVAIVLWAYLLTHWSDVQRGFDVLRSFLPRPRPKTPKFGDCKEWYHRDGSKCDKTG